MSAETEVSPGTGPGQVAEPGISAGAVATDPPDDASPGVAAVPGLATEAPGASARPAVPSQPQHGAVPFPNPPAEPRPGARPGTAAGGGPGTPAQPPLSGTGEALRSVGMGVSILALLLLGFVAHITLLSQLGHARAQQVAFSDFRYELANGTAPLGQRNANGELYALGTSMAVLEIPYLGLHEVVFEGTTSGVLQSGPGHRRDTVLPGQAGTSVIMGRQAAYGAPFGRLELLQPGEPFTVTTGQGAHTYHVTGIRRAGDPQPAVLADGEGRLTLVTAYGNPFRPDEVLRVDAELVSDPVPAPPRPLRSAMLPQVEQAMEGDPGGWTELVLWGLAAAIAAAGVAWASVRWGAGQAWIIAIPLLGGLGVAIADQVAVLLPNLI